MVKGVLQFVDWIKNLIAMAYYYMVQKITLTFLFRFFWSVSSINRLSPYQKYKETRPNEFGSMTARNDNTCPIESIFCHKRPLRGH